MMKRWRAPFAVGLLFLAGLVMLVYMFRTVESDNSTSGDTYTVLARFDDASGLVKSSRVTISGIPVGTIASIRLDPDNMRKALVAVRLERAIQRGSRSGSRLGEDPDGRARIGWLKLFADGTLGSQTAALLEPREGSTDIGVFRQGPEELLELVRRAADAGIASQIHAIGDGAVRAALDALAPSAAAVPLMPRVEHVQLVHPSDRRRFATLRVAASVQPVHLREDAESARRDWGARAESCGYTWNTLVASGAVVAFGTDAPVEPIDPWPGIALAVLRRDPSWGPDAAPFGPHEALDLEQALRAATLAPAQAARETDRGHLTPGARADLIVLPAAPREPNGMGASFAAVRPRVVVMDGEIVLEV